MSAHESRYALSRLAEISVAYIVSTSMIHETSYANKSKVILSAKRSCLPQ